MSTPDTPANLMTEMLVQGWLNFCWAKVDGIEADPQNGKSNQEQLEIVLTYMELINQNRQGSSLSAIQEEDYQDLFNWLKCNVPSLDTSQLQ